MILLISAFLTAMYMLLPVIKAFFSRKDSANNIDNVKEANALMQIPMGICAVLCIVMGIMATPVIETVKGVLGI